MNAGTVLADFLSRDPQRIWQACGAVARSWDRAALRGLAMRRADIVRQTEGVALGGAVRANALQLAFALRKLDLAVGEACFCTLYPGDEMFNPSREADDGHVEVLGEVVDAAAGEARWRCRCRACGAAFRVREVTGHHYAQFTWERD